MASQPPKLEEYETMDALARRAGKNRERVRALCVAAGIAIRWAGTDEHPHLRARWADLERVILSRRYDPPGRPKRRPKPMPAAANPLHPLVKC